MLKTSEPANLGAGTSECSETSDCQTLPVIAEIADDKKLAWPQNRIDGEQYTLVNVEKM